MNDSTIINTREKKLCESLNKFWRGALCGKGIKTDDITCEIFSISQLVELKKAVSDINNLITLRATISFVDFLKNENIVTGEEVKEMLTDIESTSANANGFDVEYHNDTHIIAEVKCNIPNEDGKFLAQQKTGILNDIAGLSSNSKKMPKGNIKKSDCLRFMVILDYGKSREAMENLINNNPDKCKEVTDYKTASDKKKIQIVYIPIDK